MIMSQISQSMSLRGLRPIASYVIWPWVLESLCLICQTSNYKNRNLSGAKCALHVQEGSQTHKFVKKQGTLMIVMHWCLLLPAERACRACLRERAPLQVLCASVPLACLPLTPCRSSCVLRSPAPVERTCCPIGCFRRPVMRVAGLEAGLRWRCPGLVSLILPRRSR